MILSGGAEIVREDVGADGAAATEGGLWGDGTRRTGIGPSSLRGSVGIFLGPPPLCLPVFSSLPPFPSLSPLLLWP